MGILDDAIRQHLELKRQHGAGDEDLERLENEAFGPATRPGDPDFVDPDASAPDAPDAPDGALASDPVPVTGEDPVAPGAAGDDDDAPAWLSTEEETTVAPATETAAEQARNEHPALGDTADHPAPIQLGPEAEAEAPPDAPAPSAAPAPGPVESADGEPPEAPESSIFDGEEFDFELDLEDEAPLAAEPAAPEPPLPSPTDPVVTPTTTDHDLPPTPVSPPPGPGEDAPAGDAEKSDEDLLEETPDFLQDAPEGEDLWFEQGPPKDFDFDDDDD